MEVASLSLAHSHARNAIHETRKANPIAASEEHDLAAGEFANAAKGTADFEALRVLRLLEKHHLRLASILKAKPEDSHSLSSTQTAEPPLDPADEFQSGYSPSSLPPSQTLAVGSPQSPNQGRETPSIASNLATARGIPPAGRRPGSQSLAQLSPQLAEGRVVNPPRKSKLSEMGSRSPEGDQRDPLQAQPSSQRGHGRLPTSSLAPPPPIATAASEEPFARFYSTFNNLISTISAPLAFAGLPLNPSEPTTPATESTIPRMPPPPQQSQQPLSSRSTAPSSRTGADPDLTRIFSRAALRAVREENGFGPVAESFYVVPTTGGTMSYAGMLNNIKQSSNTTDEDPDGEFVDARETPAGNSPVQSRYRRQPRPGSTQEIAAARRPPSGSTQTWEELHVENETLKNVVVDLGDRLRAFELGAQKSSLALHASMRQFSSPTSSVMPGSKVPPLPGSAAGPLAGLGAATKPLEDRIRELEEELKAVKKDNRKLGRENQKYLGVIEKYRERWEALKEGARERVKGASSSGGAASEGSRRTESKDEDV